ncbi:MAG TPA: hypothetical protein VI138_00495 [Candidatus Dormibacteraeota bacterium]
MGARAISRPLLRLVLAPQSLGLYAVGLAAAAGIFTGTELYLAVQAASGLLAHGIIYFWPVVLGLIGLALDVTAATIAVLGGGLMLLRRRTGRRLLVAALAAGIAGETVLAFVDRAQYSQAASIVWIALLVAGYLLLIVSAVIQRRRRPRPVF